MAFKAAEIAHGNTPSVYDQIPYQAKERSSKIEKHRLNRRFSEQEDEMLIKLVNIYGPRNWTFIASHLGTRNARQCRDRWFSYLSPDSNPLPWTQEEEERLRALVVKFDYDWQEIKKYFNGRAIPQIRNKWRTLERRRINGKQRRNRPTLRPGNVRSVKNSNSFGEKDVLNLFTTFIDNENEMGSEAFATLFDGCFVTID